MSLVTEAKGQFAQTLVSTLLEWAGYRVVRFGIEETVSELKASLARGEWAYELPNALTAVPDFLVLDPQSSTARLIEVKFSNSLGGSGRQALHKSLVFQNERWQDVTTVLVTPSPPSGDPMVYQSYMRVIKPNDLHLLAELESLEKLWSKLPTLGSFFSKLHSRDRFHVDADRLIPAIRAWAEVN